MKTLLLVISILAISSTSFAQSYRVDVDEDSCWNPPNWCIVASSSWGSDASEKRLRVKYQNVCEHRIYIRYCNERLNGRADCGSNGIRGGRSDTWSPSNATGDYNWRIVGVLEGSNDWVCAGKVDGWSD